ncbi:hypothetical protein KJ656_00225, partial [bacterium]|nr:hypothetical protein [bacterium]
YAGIELLLAEQKETVSIIKNLGIDKFKNYFLYGAFEKSTSEISSICKISEQDVKKIIDIINKLAIQNEFYYPSKIYDNPKIRYYKIAKIEKDKTGNLIISFFSPQFVRGKYIILKNAGKSHFSQ